MISKLKELITFDSNLSATEIETRFSQIAQTLFADFAIQKGGERFLFKEIEFYFYNQKHRDIITHPRNSSALCWYVNDFGGIDLNFESHVDLKRITGKNGKETLRYDLNENSCFGGILVRQLENEKSHEVLNGPWACSELFRCFDSTNSAKDLPILVVHHSGMVGYIREPRLNLLKRGQKPEDKVNYILDRFDEHPEQELLYKDFQRFKEKRYRYLRCECLPHDAETNEVYFSDLLKDKRYGHPAFHQRLVDLLNSIGIEPRTAIGTRDYWIRDFMPFQLEKDLFFGYTYRPDYLINSKNPEDKDTITDWRRVNVGHNLKYHASDLVIDGGNMVACGPYVIMTDKVYGENHVENGDVEFKFRLESALGHPVIIIPWTLHGDFHADDTDKYGHADGFIKWCGGNRILIGNHGDTYPNEAEAIRCQLEDYGFVVTEMGFKDKVKTPCTELNWAYINFLQVGQEIIMPKLNIEEDAIAYDYIQNAFPNCHISQIEMTELVREGGALHCISWNIIK